MLLRSCAFCSNGRVLKYLQHGAFELLIHLFKRVVNRRQAVKTNYANAWKCGEDSCLIQSLDKDLP